MRSSARRAALACAALATLAACRQGEKPRDTLAVSQAGGTTAALPTTTPQVSAVDALKGKWTMQSIPTSGRDTSPTLYTIDASGDTSQWTLNFAGRRQPVKLHVVSSGGDSIVTRSDEYESVRRKGMRVTTMTVLRPQGDRVTGMTTAHYKTKGGDSVLMLRSEGTRMP